MIHVDAPGSHNKLNVNLTPLANHPPDKIKTTIGESSEPCDAHFERRSRILKNGFIEVYVGTLVYEEVGLTVVIVMSLQATDRLFEVVIIDLASGDELSRMYIFEEELHKQLKMRLEALTNARNTHASGVAAGAPAALLAPPPHDLSSDSSSHSPSSSAGDVESRTIRRRSIAEVVPVPQQQSEPAPRRKSLTPVFKPTPRPPLRAQTLSGVPKKSISELHHDLLGSDSDSGGRSLQYHFASNALFKEQELENLIVTGACSAKVRPTAVAYFGLMEGSKLDPEVELKKVDREAMLRDYALLDSDVSATGRDIACSSAAILHSLYARHVQRQGDHSQLQFLLFDGACFF